MTKEVNFNVEKLEGGFLVSVSTETRDSRTVVRKLSEVIALLKAAMADEKVE